MTLDEIARGLTDAQRRALLADRTRGESSYCLRSSIGTMDALRTRKLVLRVGGLGSMFSPQTAVKWPLTPLGLQVRQILQEQNNADV